MTFLIIFLLTPLSIIFFLLLGPIRTVFSYYYLLPCKIKKVMNQQGVYGPPWRFLVGNVFDISAMVSKSTESDMTAVHHDIVPRLLPYYLQWSEKYGGAFLFWNSSEPRLCLTDTEMIREFLSSKFVQTTGRSWLQREGTKQFIGRGLLMANGRDWHRQRHVVAPMFMGEKLKSYMGNMVECTRRMLRSLHEAVGTSPENEVEIGGYMTEVTGDIISHIGFGSSYDEGKKIFELLNQLQSFTAKSTKYLWFPGSRFFPNRFKREERRVKAEVEYSLMKMIQARKESMEMGITSGNDLLGSLILSESLSVQKKRGRDNFMDTINNHDNDLSLDLQLIMDECKTIYFAGHETTALILTWVIMLLATNPSWQAKARAEIFDVCGRSPAMDSPLSSDHISKLSLLHMIINETLRLYPSVAIIPRIALEDMKLGDLHIPKGLSIWIPVLAIHHSKEIWGDDADEFNPGRWAAKSYSQTRNFVPFSAGPRNCVGQGLAMMEAKIILALLLSEFSFTISEKYRHAPINVISLKPKHGVPIYLTPLSPLRSTLESAD